MTPHLADTPVLTTKRLTLRAIGPQDVEACTAFMASDRAKYMGGPYSAHDAWVQTCRFIGEWVVRGTGLFAICLKGSDQAIGEVGVFNAEGYPEPELGWGLWDPAHEGRGYAKEAAIAVREHLYADMGWYTVVSYIDPANAPSIALAERLGCTLDSGAPLPDLPDWGGTLIYRHPAPADLGLGAGHKEARA
ncbi:Protein N-acetyltransferase, RimJ/RimL family [Roseovarius nanhaiticus]|uniref:Protein N-acetyltransferase, RimJ/RimL family n=1 Tax=Roseovarius nanhaiticus TaxID=573024 RepID=A0A1N7EZK8_9RHOB|nr:GNAT family N-acetyltransferase [Roseovarius nanhaiticus]SEK63895.1 Protein N-acetyltransferase, RimJ/RimL family [Roseovarius nanhaiticus]SIR93529.1 Protein N-acetyltransferase, RimJ/RimL family [Roseovarius nanhaiticus]